MRSQALFRAICAGVGNESPLRSIGWRRRCFQHFGDKVPRIGRPACGVQASGEQRDHRLRPRVVPAFVPIDRDLLVESQRAIDMQSYVSGRNLALGGGGVWHDGIYKTAAAKLQRAKRRIGNPLFAYFFTGAFTLIAYGGGITEDRIMGPSDDADNLAAEVKAWRGKMPVRQAAELLGVNRRTLEGVEQGRPFAHPQLLRHAMKTIRIEGKK